MERECGKSNAQKHPRSKRYHIQTPTHPSKQQKERRHNAMHARKSVIPFFVQLVDQAILCFAISSRPSASHTADAAVDALVAPSPRQKARAAGEQDEEDVLNIVKSAKALAHNRDE